MRIDVKKQLFVGMEKDKAVFFEAAQKLGIIHFIAPKSQASKEVPPDLKETLTAIKILNALPVVEQEELEDFSLAEEIAGKIIELKATLENLLEQQRILSLEISRVAPFGNYSKEDIAWIEKNGNRKLQFFCAKHGFAFSDAVPKSAIYVGTENELDYFLAINPEEMQFEKMIEIKPEAPLIELEHKYRLLQKQAHDAEARLKNDAKYNAYLHKALIHQSNHHRLWSAEGLAEQILDNKLFAVAGWVPENKLEALQEIAKAMRVHIEEIAIEASDAVPTYLDNHGLGRMGEDLVNIYDTPSTSDKDPSLWVLFFFALFFSMIIGDAGYGLILLLVAVYVRMKFTKISSGGRRFLNLSFILASFCIAWGLLTTSFFGISFSPDSPIRKVSLLTWLVEKKAAYHFSRYDDVAKEWVQKFPALEGLKDPSQILMQAVSVDPHTQSSSYDMLGDFSNDILLELAIFIGVIHVTLSLLRNLKRNWAGIGWILFIAGCYLYFPKFLDATSLIHYVFGVNPVEGAENGVWLIFGGIGLAVAIGVIKDKLFGLLECMNILQIFGDVMSYLRLYALGLSGALVVSTTNELASGLHFVLAAVVLVIAHTVNLVLCIMGGVIHGLRLNFLEWYHYSFEGGGKLFNPLKKIEVE